MRGVLLSSLSTFFNFISSKDEGKNQVNTRRGPSSPKGIYTETYDKHDQTIIVRKMKGESGHSLTAASANYKDKKFIMEPREKFEW